MKIENDQAGDAPVKNSYSAKVEIIRETGDDGKTKIKRLVMSSETPCPHEIYDTMKREYVDVPFVLKHDEKSIVWDWIAHGVAVRDRHYGPVIARGMEPHLDAGKLVSDDIRWSVQALAGDVKSDLETGVLQDLSIEADLDPTSFEEIRDKDGNLEKIIVNRWTPLAVAVVVNGADQACGVNRERPQSVVTKLSTPEHQAEKQEKNMDKDTMKEVVALARKYGVKDDIVNKWIEEATPIAEIRRQVLDMKAPETETPAVIDEAKVIRDAEKSAKRQYSLTRAIRSIVADLARGVDAGFEIECSQELAHQYQKQPNGIFLSIARAFDGTSGAGLLNQGHMGDKFVDVLRSRMVLGNSGLNMLSGLVGTQTIPVVTADCSGYWVGPGGQITGSAPTTASLTLAPKTCGVMVDITRQLLISASPAADLVIREAIAKQIARTIQKGVLVGSGTNNQPTGIATKITPTDATAISYDNILDLQEFVEDNEVDASVCRYIMNGANFLQCKRTPLSTGGGDGFLGIREGGKRLVADMETLTTSDVGANYIIFGDFSGAFLGLHSALDVITDSATNSSSGGLRLVGLQDVSVGVVEDRFATLKITPPTVPGA